MGTRTSILARGAIAGAAGTAALNATTYIDMAVRGRPASSTPQDAVRRIAEVVGMTVRGDSETRRARTTGLASLLGIASGVCSGIAVETIRTTGRVHSSPATTALSWSIATLAGNGPMVGLGITDPRHWGRADWAADLVPHAAYAIAVTAVLKRCSC